MAKLTNYKGTAVTPAGFTQKGTGDYALMEAHAIQTREDGTRLDTELNSLPSNLTNGTGEGSIQLINVPHIEDAEPANSIAISRNAVALGDGAVAGCKAFPVKETGSNYFVVEDSTMLSESLIGAGGSVVASITYTDGDHTYEDFSYLYWNIIKIDRIEEDKVYFQYKNNFSFPSDITVNAFETVVFFDQPDIGSEDYGEGATSEGYKSKAYGYVSHAEGSGTRSIGNESHTEGYETFATTYSHAEGTSTKAYGRTSHVEGKGSSVYGFAAHGEGQGVTVHGMASHGEGSRTVAGDPNDTTFLYNHSLNEPIAAHAEGINTRALSRASHTSGKDTQAGRRAYRIKAMENLLTSPVTRLDLDTVVGLSINDTVTIVGDASSNKAVTAVISDLSEQTKRVILDRNILNTVSLASTVKNSSNGMDNNYMVLNGSTDAGDIVVAHFSTALGLGTVASTTAQLVNGKYNIIDDSNQYAHIVGNGSDLSRSNAYMLDWQGNGYYAGDVYSDSKKLATQEYVDNLVPECFVDLLTLGDVVAFDITPNTTGRITITFNNCYFRYNGKRYSIGKNADGSYVTRTSGLTASTQLLVAKLGSSLNIYNDNLAFRDAAKYVLADDEVIILAIGQAKNEAALCYPANLSTKVKYSVNGKVCGYQVIEDAEQKYDTVYVATTGNDTNNGSTNALAFKTISAALKTGAETIIIAPGTYIERFNAATTRNNLTIKVAHVARNDDETLEEWKSRDSVIITAKNADGTFISQNVKYLAAFRNISNLVLEDLIFQETNVGSLCSIINCANFTVRNCQFVAAHDGHGLAINNSSGDVINCVAKYAGKDINGTTMSTATVHRDGFNIHTAGSVNIIDCIGAYNLDDGVSHHDATTGVVRGGEFHYNGKGGVASPTYGAKVDIYNVWSHDNQYGIYAVTDSGNLQSKTINISNCVIENNDVGLRADYYTIHSHSNTFKNNNTEISNTGSTIINDLAKIAYGKKVEKIQKCTIDKKLSFQGSCSLSVGSATFSDVQHLKFTGNKLTGIVLSATISNDFYVLCDKQETDFYTPSDECSITLSIEDDQGNVHNYPLKVLKIEKTMIRRQETSETYDDAYCYYIETPVYRYYNSGGYCYFVVDGTTIKPSSEEWGFNLIDIYMNQTLTENINYFKLSNGYTAPEYKELIQKDWHSNILKTSQITKPSFIGFSNNEYYGYYNSMIALKSDISTLDGKYIMIDDGEEGTYDTFLSCSLP